MGGLLVSNKIHFIGIWSCSNLGQVAITVPISILFLYPIYHGFSFLIHFKQNLLPFLSVSLHSLYLHFSSCMFQSCSFNMGFMSLLSLCVSVPFNARVTNYNHSQPVTITLWLLILRHTHSSPRQFMPISHKSNPSSVPRGIVDSYFTLPWVTWEAVTGVEDIPCWGLLRHTLGNGPLVYPSQGGGYCTKAALHWSRDCSVVNDPLGEPGRIPLYAGPLSTCGSMDRDRMFSLHFAGKLLD